MLRCMGIGTKGDDLTAHFMITGQNLFRWIGMSQSIFKSACITFQADIFLNQNAENLVNDISVFFIRVIRISVGTVAYHIIKMSTYIKTGIFSEIFQNTGKITAIGCFLTAIFEKYPFIRIAAVYDMDGTDYKVKGILTGKFRKFSCKMRLKPQFNSKI